MAKASKGEPCKYMRAGRLRSRRRAIMNKPSGSPVELGTAVGGDTLNAEVDVVATAVVPELHGGLALCVESDVGIPVERAAEVGGRRQDVVVRHAEGAGPVVRLEVGAPLPLGLAPDGVVRVDEHVDGVAVVQIAQVHEVHILVVQRDVDFAYFVERLGNFIVKFALINGDEVFQLFVVDAAVGEVVVIPAVSYARFEDGAQSANADVDGNGPSLGVLGGDGRILERTRQRRALHGRH